MLGLSGSRRQPLLGQGVGGEDFQKLAGGGDDIIVPRGGGISVDELQRDLRAARVILLRPRELRWIWIWGQVSDLGSGVAI